MILTAYAKISLRELARIIGNTVASFPPVTHVTYGPLNYRHLWKEKITYWKYHKGNFWGKLDYLLNQKLRYNGRLITLTIDVTQGWPIHICGVHAYAWVTDMFLWLVSCICSHVCTFTFCLDCKTFNSDLIKML